MYAAFFSGFYTGLLVLLFALFLRPVGFDYRSKLPDPRWRTEGALAERALRVIRWSSPLFVAGFVMAGIWVGLDVDGGFEPIHAAIAVGRHGCESGLHTGGDQRHVAGTGRQRR
ncbi:hypothetical protein [Methylomicrobium album]|uniref:hypothetical protein n=1 Tax=Methylomicrobium album TaxID=39775 RepID=UPI00020D8F03